MVYASAEDVVKPIDLVVNCEVVCHEERETLKKFIEKKVDEKTLKGITEVIVKNFKVERIRYELLEDEGERQLHFYISKKRRITNIVLKMDNVELEQDILRYLPFRKGDYYSSALNKKAVVQIRRKLSENGHILEVVNSKVSKTKEGVELTYSVNIKKTKILKKIDIVSSNTFLKNMLNDTLSLELKKTWRKEKIVSAIALFSKRMRELGHLKGKVNFSFDEIDNNIFLKATILDGGLYSLRLRGLYYTDEDILKELVKKEIDASVQLHSLKLNIENRVLKYMNEIGLFKAEVKVDILKGHNKYGDEYSSIIIDVDENSRARIRNISFAGNNFFSDKILKEVFLESESILSERGLYDEKYYKSFVKKVEHLYHENGFLLAEVKGPFFDFNKEYTDYNLSYQVFENQRILVNNLTITGIPKEYLDNIKRVLSNKSGKYLNVTTIKEDITKILSFLKKRGYYFSKLLSTSDEIISYDSALEICDINMSFDSGKKVYINDFIFAGNKKTRSRVIDRELFVKRGDLLIQGDILNLKDRILALGLFSSVKIAPYVVKNEKDHQKVNLLIQVSEKKFGLGILSPGYRTDLGPKLETSITFGNLRGDNHSLSFKLAGNQRINGTGIDGSRKRDNKNLLEYKTEMSYRWPYQFYSVLNSKIDFNFLTSFKRKRFYNFDADILKLSPSWSKNFGENISTSLKYQFEKIRQFSAVQEKDEDQFKIGSLTPSIVFDYRDSSVNTRKGSYHSISWEFANSTFGSMKNDDIEVNFSRLMVRNRYYIPIQDWTLAFSVALGYQKNYADKYIVDDDGNVAQNSDGSLRTRGYIPSIKVFRLSGVDRVRGFADDETTRLGDGRDIGDLRVQDTAYLASYKIEPRFYINDNLVFNLFLDAGSLFVNHFSPLDVRTAFGAGLKLLTPVGTLDIDYGVKLHRKSYGDNTRERVGRLHISVGTF